MNSRELATAETPQLTELKIEQTIPERIQDKISIIAHDLDFANPLVALLILYTLNSLRKQYKNFVDSITSKLFFSQKIDDEINSCLHFLKECIRCDRVVLGLMVNGETTIGGNYHIRKLVITHEACGIDVPSCVSRSEARIPLALLAKESKLYTDDKNWTSASVDIPSIDDSCRRYLDSIECHSILTIKISAKVNGILLDVGYLSFQWTATDVDLVLTKDHLDDCIKIRGKKDLTYFINRITSLVISQSDRKSFLSSVGNLLKAQSPI